MALLAERTAEKFKSGTITSTFTYNVPLDEAWQFRVHGDTCTVIPPAIRPSLPLDIRQGG